MSRMPCRSRSTRCEQWSIGDRMLNDLLRGVDLEVRRHRGMAPRHAAAGTARLSARPTEIREQAAELAMRGPAHRQAGAGRRYDVDVDLGDGRRLTGTVTPVYRRPAGVGDLFAARAEAPARVVDSAGGAGRRTTRAATGRRSASAGPSATTPRRRGFARRPDPLRCPARSGRDLRRRAPRAACRCR